MGDKTWNIGEFQIFLGIYLILYEKIKIVSDLPTWVWKWTKSKEKTVFERILMVL